MRPRKRILYQKSRSWNFVYIAYKEIISMSLEVAFPHFSTILFLLSTAMFVLIKNLDYRRRKVLCNSAI